MRGQIPLALLALPVAASTARTRFSGKVFVITPRLM